uniref:Cation-dependent mannose-6-phosphate receptor n=1 Tax=Nothoprocta perdicaria TaxID=30464 RepID=A0A8C6Z9S0_NOTPE
TSRMSSAWHSSGPLIVLMVLAVSAWAEDVKEKDCDVIGDETSESQTEKALLKKLEPLSQIRFNTTVELGTTENYTYHFRVCREVDSSLHDLAGLVQIDRKTGKTTVIGRINETQVFNGSDWIMLIYKGGDSYGRHCSGEKRRAVIMISCKRGLTADGCDFVCRSKPRNAPAAYRGVGDDQLGEESEERDDHLLPM